MSQVITNAFETYWQGCLTDQVPVVLDEVVLADIPNLDITAPIDPNTSLPPQAQIVHRHPVDQRGRINNNAVAYSIVMDTTVGNFSFNAMYLVNKASGMVGMIVYKGRETKTKTDQATGTTGNSLVKSMLMEYDQAATATVTTVEAGTWQIDYSARLLGMDEQLRLQAIACFGSSAFFGDGFKLINKAGSYKVQPGVAMVGGLRIQLDVEQAITVGAKPVGVWVDVHRAGTILSRWDNHFEFKTSTTELTDYTDSNGYRHYVAKLGVVEANATVTDKRQADESAELWEAIEALRKQSELALTNHEKGRNHPDASESEKGFARFGTVEEATPETEAKASATVMASIARVFTVIRSAAAEATEQLRGTLRRATQAEIDSRANVAAAVAPHQLRELGVNQRWTDMLSSRALNTIYTNTTGRPIAISVGANASSNGCSLGLSVDGVDISRGTHNYNGNAATSNITIVPAGSTYRAWVSGGSGTLNAWFEMR
ncbi:phage tail protein [Aeromonas veronii]|uniref:phage tail-collar fiber domain-containing protein n=1 Tax=Aeromonas veronii TaxID=654 RepID=UPI003BA1DC2E